MKIIKHFLSVAFLLVSIAVFGQETKTYKESFKVGKDAELVVNSSYTDVIIQYWNKSTVEVDARMTVKGEQQENIEDLFKNWQFEALGNSNKVQVTSKANGMYSKGDEFVFISAPKMDWVAPEDVENISILVDSALSKVESVEIPNFVMPQIYMDSIKIDIEGALGEEFDFEAFQKEGKIYFEQWSKEMKENSENFKIQIKELKESEEYKEAMEEAKRIWIEVDKETREALEDAKESMKDQIIIIRENEQANREQAEMIREEMQKHKEEMKVYAKKIKKQLSEDGRGSLDVDKRLIIKVPKGIRLILDVKYGTLNLPAGAQNLSASVSYGEINAPSISGDESKINLINTRGDFGTIHGARLEINNSRNMVFASLSQSEVRMNSSIVKLQEVGKDVQIDQRFGKLKLLKFTPDMGELNVKSSYGTVYIDNDQPYGFEYNGDREKLVLKNQGDIRIDAETKGDQTIYKGLVNDAKGANQIRLNNKFGKVYIQ